MARAPRAAPTAKKPPRRRRDAEAARTAILDAAEQRLVSMGPAGIRLQEVAQDVGVSHPTVLHHFGSREALVQAVISRSVEAIHARLVETIRSWTGEEGQIAAMMDGVYEALSAGGRGRVLLWLALEGVTIDPANVQLGDVVDALHAMRQSRAGGKEPLAREDSAYAVILAALALLGSTVLGPTLLERAGLPNDAAAGARFRSWLAQLLLGRLDVAR